MDTETIITESHSPETFDVLSFVEATAYPTSTVTVFQDVKSAAEYIKLVTERGLAEDAAARSGGEFKDKFTEQIEELGNKVRKSAIIFELRGMPPAIVKSIIAPEGSEDDSKLMAELREDKLVAESIVSIKNSEGVASPNVDSEGVAKLRGFLKEGEFGKLLQGVIDVNFNAAIFDQATDAGFSSRSDDVAE